MKLWTLAAAGALLALPALAQTPPTSPTTVDAAQHTSDSSNAAVSTSSQMEAKPSYGANSFSIGEAMRRLQAHGYTNVTNLHKDTHGVWRGMATPGTGSTTPGVTTLATSAPQPGNTAQPVSVWLDYKGNVGVQ